MNEVSGGKQDNIPNSAAWETLASQSSLPGMHHHHLQESSTVTQVIVPTPVKLQPPILVSPSITVEHCHMQQVNFTSTLISLLRSVIFHSQNTAPGMYPDTELSSEFQQQGWKKFWSKRENRPYFWNKLTGESLWVLPSAKPSVIIYFELDQLILKEIIQSKPNIEYPICMQYIRIGQTQLAWLENLNLYWMDVVEVNM